MRATELPDVERILDARIASASAHAKLASDMALAAAELLTYAQRDMAEAMSCTTDAIFTSQVSANLKSSHSVRNRLNAAWTDLRAVKDGIDNAHRYASKTKEAPAQ